jgi:3-oxoacyl-[acyl-carrier-protein] synthase-3
MTLPSATQLSGVQLIGVGSAVPPTIVTNNDLATFLDTSDEWIHSRTGIRQRRVIAGDETLTDLCLQAGRNALAMAQVTPEQLGLIIVATATPDERYPATAARLQQHLPAPKAFGFDLSLACTGFAAALQTATQFLKAGTVDFALVVGADAHSRVMDWTDRNTCVLFGDAAGAVVLKRTALADNGLLSFDANLDGHLGSELAAQVRYGNYPKVAGPTHVDPYVKMNGREVYKFAVSRVPHSMEEAVAKAGKTLADVDWIVLHQANSRIMDAISDRLHFPRERMVMNLDRYGNTSAASIPLVLDEAVRDGRIQPNHTLLMSGFGGGLSWTSTVATWAGVPLASQPQATTALPLAHFAG